MPVKTTTSILDRIREKNPGLAERFSAERRREALESNGAKRIAKRRRRIAERQEKAREVERLRALRDAEIAKRKPKIVGDGTATVLLTRGLQAVIDEQDAEAVSEVLWTAHTVKGRQYARNAKLGLMHRFILGYPETTDIDHLDGDGLNNRRSNLKPCNRRENMENIKANKNRTDARMTQRDTAR